MEISQGYPHGGHNLLHRLDSRTCHSGMCWHVWTCFWRAVLPGKTSWTYSIYSWHFREACWPCHTFLTGTERPAVVTKMNLTLSADHRVFDSDIGGNTEPCYQFEFNGVFFFLVESLSSSLMRLNLSKFHRSVPFGFVLKLQQHSKTYVIKPASCWCVRHSQDLRPRRAFFCDFIEFCSSCAIFTYWWLLIIGELAGATHCRLHRSLIWVIEAPWCYFEHLFFVPFVYSQDNVVCMFCYEDCNWMLRNRIFRVMLRNLVLQITWCHSFDGPCFRRNIVNGSPMSPFLITHLIDLLWLLLHALHLCICRSEAWRKEACIRLWTCFLHLEDFALLGFQFPRVKGFLHFWVSHRKSISTL